MELQIITFVIILFFLISIVFQLAVDLMIIVFNAFLLYAFGLRSFKDVRKKKYELYLICGFLALFVVLFTGGIKYLWGITSFLVLTCIIVWLFEKVKEKYGK